MIVLKRISIVFLLLFVISLVDSVADWPCRPDMSTPVATDGGNQWNVRLASDGENGSIMVWQDRRNGSTDKLFVQRMNSIGNPVWQSGGIQVSLNAGFQYYPQIISDGQGGAFIVWEDNRSGADYDIFAQRISSTGVMLWSAGGTVVCNVSGQQYFPQIIPDQTGGVIIVWQDRRSGQYDIYAQRLNANGQALWLQNGKPVCSSSGDQIDPRPVQDFTGGVIVGWTDYRGGIPDVYAQRLDALGQSAWSANGNLICGAANNQTNVQICSDLSGGAILSWQDRRSATSDKIYAQRVTANGLTQWTSNGIQLAQANGFQYYPRMVSDGSGGAVVTWQDNRTGADYDIYTQRVNSTGQLLWPAQGLSVSSASGHQYNPQLVKDGQSVLYTWQDKRNGTDFDIYIQRFSLGGQSQWIVNGAAASVSAQDQFNPQLTGDLGEGAIVAWADYRAGNGFMDVFSQRIGANGKCAGGCYRSFTQESFSEKAPRRIRYDAPPPMPNTGSVRDSIFYRGMFPDGMIVGIDRSDSASRYGWEYFSRSSYVRRSFPQNGSPRPFKFRSSRYFIGALRNPTSNLYNNHLAAEQLVLKLNIAASDVGLVDENFGDLVFKDTSKTVNPLNNKSLREIVKSVDSMLTFWKAYQGKVDYLVIDASLAKINRAFSGDFDTVSTHPLRITSVRSLFTVPYLVSNTAAPVVIPSFQTRPFNDDVPEEFTLSQNYPNPFNPYTTIEFNLNESAIVTIKIFNILGQEIVTLFNRSSLEEGPQFVDFDGSNLSSGVYFYQLIAEPLDSDHRTLISVKKMVLMK